ncbi:methyltransferase domain-containing protein [Desulfuromonas sp. AOP6]|uniref:class I SAM-dependent methyltransferase n=1 Tax=Desulfuromonas sp. AOP6 TaxID=1566351 RepID=UPI00126E9F96|nr:methyltransferase domain-containing protein [Desulfuromonas sp. AOP6]BCA79272.1 methyltransferase [Desulfuromonas sp. AOP6]
MDPSKQEAFGRRMADILNGGALNLAMAIGYRTGLFEAMATFTTAQPIEAIAEQAGLHPRYVREWLGIMVTADIVELECQPAGNGYRLPPEHAAFLTRAGGNTNLAVYTQEIPLLTVSALEQVIEAFPRGTGVPYHNYPRFQAFMTELASAKHRQVLLEIFLPSVDEGRLLDRLQQGIRVCDFGCGEGTALLLMAQAYPQSQFTAIDIDEQAVAAGKTEAQRLGLDNAEFLCLDAATLHQEPAWREAFDYILAFDAIHDQRAPLQALQSVHHLLAADGLFSMIDIAAHTDHQDNRSHPLGPFLYTVSLMHCLPVGLHDGGAGLGMMWGEELAVELLQEAGFEEITVEAIPQDPFNLHFCCRK